MRFSNRSPTTILSRRALEPSESASDCNLAKFNELGLRAISPSQTSKERVHTLAALQRILKTILPSLSTRNRFYLFAGFTSATLHAVCPAVASYFIAKMITTFYLPHNWQENATSYALYILAIAILDGTTSYSVHYCLEKASQAWVDHLRVEAMSRVLAQTKAWFDDECNDLSEICSSIDRRAEEMRNIIGCFAAPIYIIIVTMIFATMWAFIKCWKLTLVSVASILGLYGITMGFELVSSKWESRTDRETDIVTSIFVETFTSIRTIRALTIESYFHKKYNKATNQAFSVGVQRGVYSGFLFGLSDGAINFVTAAIFGYGVLLAKSGAYSVEAILTVYALMLFSMANTNAVVANIPQMSSSIDAAMKLLKLCQLNPQSHENRGEIELSKADDIIHAEPIKFVNQSFAYPSRPEVKVLHNVTFTVPYGRCTAIIGSSGSGKSTIASLLLRLYPPTLDSNPDLPDPATIFVCGYDIRTLKIETLRNFIALVPQSPTLLPSTVRENILYGITDPTLTTDSNLKSAAQAAGIHDFIHTLPQKYDTVIGDAGLGMSGGQVQRIAIARALARKLRILILDEPTSALDWESAEVIRQSIRRLTRASNGTSGAGRERRKGAMTVVVITHAREMMECADHIVVMKDGTVVEEGGYRELVCHRGELWEMLRAGGDVGGSGR